MKLIYTMWQTIKSFCQNFSLKDWLIIILTFLTIYFMFSARHERNEHKYATVVYEDTISTYKNKLKEEYASKTMYIQTIDQLKENNKELYDEIKNLKDKPVVITKTEMVVKFDTIRMDNNGVDEYTKQDTTYYDLKWNKLHPSGFYDISGFTTVNSLNPYSFSTTLTNLTIPVKLTLDIIEKDKNFSIIGKTDNPYVIITDYNSSFIDPTESDILKKLYKPKRWHLGPQIGGGLTGDMKATWYVGLGLTYSIISF